jgi:putative glycosyltransferase (TIGR04372 family)
MGLFCKGLFMNMYHLFAARIGHLAMNTELFLRRHSRGMVEGELFRITDHFSGEKIANEQLYKMIRRRAVVHEVTLQEYQALVAQGNTDCGMVYSGSNEFWEFNNIEPQLSFTDAELEEGQQLLNLMGIHKNPYVCIHDRSSHYLESKYPNSNFFYHNYRDCNIDNYLKAADWLTTKGIYVVRMGELVSTPLKTENPMVIDYATKHRTDFGDAFLTGTCDFFLGSSAGLMMMATIMSRPVAAANYVPFNNAPLLKEDVFIHKNLSIPFSLINEIGLDMLENKITLLEEVLKKHNTSIEENTPEQILDLAIEMYERLTNTFTPNFNSEQLKTKLRSYWKPTALAYGYVCNISSKFVDEKKHLFI